MATHKWMLYVRGGKHNPDISAVVSRVEVGLPVLVLSQVAFFFFRLSCTPPTLRTTWSRSQLPHSTSHAEDGVRFSSLCQQHFVLFFCMQHFFFFGIQHCFIFLSFFSFFLCLQHFFYFFCTQHCFFSLLFLLAKYSIRLTPGERCKKLFFTGFDNIYAFCTYAKNTQKRASFLYRRVSLEIENSLPPP